MNHLLRHHHYELESMQWISYIIMDFSFHLNHYWSTYGIGGWVSFRCWKWSCWNSAFWAYVFFVAGWRKRCIGKDLADNAALNKQFLYVICVHDTYISCALLYQVFVLYFMNKFHDLNSNDLGERNQKCCGSFSEVPLVFSFNSYHLSFSKLWHYCLK